MQRVRARLKRLSPLPLVFGLVTGGAVIVTSAPASATTYTCGEQLLGSAWSSTFTGVPVYANAQDGTSWGVNSCGGTDDYVNGVDAGGEWQCVELVNRLYLTKGWTTSHWSGNGDTLVDNLPPGLSKQNNGSITSIVPGDVVTFNGDTDNPAGHAGVVSAISGDSVTIVNQNAGTPVQQTVTYDPSAKTLSGEYGYSTQAVVHAAANTGSSSSTTSRLSAVSMPSGQQMVFWKGGDGNLDAAFWSGSAWSEQNIGSAFGFGQLSSPPGAVYEPSTGWVQVFWEGPGHSLYQAVLDTSTGSWVGGWNLNVGSSVYSQPTAAVVGSQVDVYWTDSNGDLEEAVWNGSAWVQFALGSYFWNIASAPTVADQSSGENDVFWTDTAGNLDEGVWNGAAWVGFNIPVGTISSQPATTLEPSTGFEDVFWDSSGNLQEAVWNGAAWVEFNNIPGATTMATAPTATAWGTQTDVYWTDASGNLQEAVWNGAAWVEFEIPGMGPIPAS